MTQENENGPIGQGSSSHEALVAYVQDALGVDIDEAEAFVSDKARRLRIEAAATQMLDAALISFITTITGARLSVPQVEKLVADMVEHVRQRLIQAAMMGTDP